MKRSSDYLFCNQDSNDSNFEEKGRGLVAWRKLLIKLAIEMNSYFPHVSRRECLKILIERHKENKHLKKDNDKNLINYDDLFKELRDLL